MPRYHFNVRDGVSAPDPEGTELSGLAEAERCAVKLSGDLLSDDPDRFWTGEEWHMDVTDDRGLILFSLTFIANRAPSTMPGLTDVPGRR